MASVEEYRAAGLYNPAENADDRLALLHWLEQQGFSIGDMVEADRYDRLLSLAGDRRLLLGDARRSRREAIEQSGMEPAVFDEVVIALGFVPFDDDEITFSDADIATVAAIGSLAVMFSPDEALSLIRVYGSSFARLGEATNTLYLADIEADLTQLDGTELEFARNAYEAVGLLDGFTSLLDPVLRRHIYQATERIRRATIDESNRVFFFAVGFIDLAGYTEYSGSLPPDELDQFIQQFERDAYRTTTECDARLVKLIGDAVMFVAPEIGAACAAASALIDRFGGAAPDVSPRGGLAYGQVLVRGGDYYGPIVNLASRLVDAAVPGEILVNEAVVEAIDTPGRFEPAGRRAVKGFRDPVRVWSLN
ncbi:MAG: adenylate cyclase regulatory domain-containing protein [Actinomycetota bacterium]